MNGRKRSGTRVALRIAKGASLPEARKNGEKAQKAQKAQKTQRAQEVPEDQISYGTIVDLGTHGERYVSPTELARYWRVSTDTIYRDIKKGALPAYRIGSSGTIRIRIEDARRYGRPA